MRRLSRDRQRAQTLALAAVVMIGIVGALAFVVDLGFQMETRRALQSAADAGALAGVAKLPDDQAGAIQQAMTFAYQSSNAEIADRICAPAASPLPDASASAPVTHPNVYAIATAGQKPVGAGSIYTMTVTMECTAGFSFGRILNLSTAPIRATATAAKGSPNVVKCPFPMAIYDSDGNPSNGVQDAPWNGSQTYSVGQYYPMYMKGDNGSSSNSGALDVGSGASAIRDAISNTCDGPIISMTGCAVGVTPPCANTKTGVMSGPIEQGLTMTTARYPNGRMQACGTGPYCPGQPLASAVNNISLPGGGAISFTADFSCAQQFSDVANPDGTVKPGQSNSPCIAMVPITSAYVNQSGNVNIPIEGYAMVFLAAYEKSGEILAVQYVKNVEVQADITAYNPLGSIVVRLIG